MDNKTIKNSNYVILISKSEIVHYIVQSTKKSTNLPKIFLQNKNLVITRFNFIWSLNYTRMQN